MTDTAVIQLGTYTVGAAPEITVTFRKRIAGVLTLADPTTVVYKWEEPDGTEHTLPNGDPLIIHPSTGVYYVAQLLDAAGRWYVRFEGTGNVTAAVEGCLTVRSSHFSS